MSKYKHITDIIGPTSQEVIDLIDGVILEDYKKTLGLRLCHACSNTGITPMGECSHCKPNIEDININSLFE